MLGPVELQSFVKWKKGAGKGKGGGQKGNAWNISARTPPGSAATGMGKGGFDGECSFCKQKGHMKKDCPELGKNMAAR